MTKRLDSAQDGDRAPKAELHRVIYILFLDDENGLGLREMGKASKYKGLAVLWVEDIKKSKKFREKCLPKEETLL